MNNRDSENDKTTPFLREDESKSASSAGQPPYRSDMAVPKAPIDAAMFNTFKASKKYKAPKWAAPLLMSMAIFHVALFLVMWAKSIWQIDQLEKPKNVADLAIAPPPPPPPPPPKGTVKPQDVKVEVKKRVVKELVAFKPEDRKQNVATPTVACPDCPTGGTGEDPNAPIDTPPEAPPPPPPPPPPPQPPQAVAPQLLEGQRIAGEKNIVPDDVTKTEIQRSGKDKIVGSFKLCITAGGDISTINQLKSTGFSAYDSKIQREMRQWRYRAYEVNGKAVPVCTAVTFIYSQH